jgi:hypothetical protein
LVQLGSGSRGGRTPPQGFYGPNLQKN